MSNIGYNIDIVIWWLVSKNTVRVSISSEFKYIGEKGALVHKLYARILQFMQFSTSYNCIQIENVKFEIVNSEVLQ